MNQNEIQLYEQAKKLKETYGLLGVKAEFEAEGSSLMDVVRLRRLTASLNIPLHVKIGGPEAKRDILDCFEIGVDGVIAPMVESAYGAKKFTDAMASIFGNSSVHKAINIETKAAVESIDEILDISARSIDGITIGRTDLSGSYLRKDITPDSKLILLLIEEIGTKASEKGIGVTVGGSISHTSREQFASNEKVLNHIQRIETRKIILPTSVMVNEPQALEEALKFELYYIQAKQEITGLHLKDEMERIEKLKERVLMNEPSLKMYPKS
jgi:hypothetical protein